EGQTRGSGRAGGAGGDATRSRRARHVAEIAPRRARPRARDGRRGSRPGARIRVARVGRRGSTGGRTSERDTVSNADASITALPASEVPGADVPTDDIDELVARVRERGYVTTGEIFATMPKLEPETAELAAIYARINARGVEVVDEIDEELRREDERRAGRGEEPAARTPPAPTSAAEAPSSLPRPGAVPGTSAAARHARAPRPERVEGGSF